MTAERNGGELTIVNFNGSRRTFGCLALAVAIAAASSLEAQSRRKNAPNADQGLNYANIEGLPVTRRDREIRNLRLLPAANRRSIRTFTSASLDRLLVDEFVAEGMERAREKAAEDIFFRRAHLALVGRKPSAAEIKRYQEDLSPNKKERLIDNLLGRNEFGAHQARYWRDVIRYHIPEGIARVPTEPFEEWLAKRFNANDSWAEIVGDIVTATGISDVEAQTYLIASHQGDPVQLAGEASRIFMGIQIQCAECHDHTGDHWKREQFHELAAFFGRVRVRNRQDLQTRTRRNVREVLEVRRTYRMPDLADPSSQGEAVDPIFLTGQAIPGDLPDKERRHVFGRLLTSQRNEYFAKAFVNRVWAQLFGYGFTNPVDNLGSEVPITYPKVFDALAASFRLSGYDVKQLYRVILNTKTYERRFQEIEGSFGQDVMFAAIQPSRLTADQVYDSVEGVLGELDRRRSLREEFHEAFGFDPSADPEYLEGSILQALVMMNSPAVHGRISADDNRNLLPYLLSEYETDEEIIRQLYLHVLARNPRDSEVASCRQFLSQVPDRKEAFEDILWCLVNTTEFSSNQ